MMYFRNRGTLGEVIQTMLPPEKRESITRRLASLHRLHGEELTNAFKPIIEKTLRDSVPIVQRGITQAIEDHQSELRAIGKRYESEIVNERLVPLVREEVLPIVRTHGEPVASAIGRELWDRASLWRFGWRMVYDKSPLPRRDLTEQEWQRFVDDEAVPVFEEHMDDVVKSVKEILRDVAASELVRSELTEVATELVADEELQKVIGKILRDGVAENDELREVWIANWQTAEARTALKLAGDRLEPVVREIGDELFGTREHGITPGFARVLRNQILGKDRRWLIAELSDAQESDSPPSIQPGGGPANYPMIIFAGNPPSTEY